MSWSSSALIKFADIDQTPLNYVLAEDELSWIVSITPLSGFVGSLITMFVGNSVGRKTFLIFVAVTCIISYGIMVFANIVSLIYVARFFAGVAGSASLPIIGTYLGEIADNSNRGIVGTTLSCFFSLGVALGLSISSFVPLKLFNGLIALIPSVFILITCFFGAETPQFLILKGEREKAKEVLKKLRGNAIDLDEEIEQLANNINSDKSTRKNIFKTIMGSIRPITIALLLNAFQQLAGVPQTFAYAETIFNLTNVELKPSISAIIVGVMNFISTLVAPILVKKIGRRVLMIISSGGTLVLHVLLGTFFILKDKDIYSESISFFPLVCIAISMITYNIGFGALPLLISIELCPPDLRTFVTSSATIVIGIVNFILGKFFYDFERAVGLGGIFMFYGSMCAISTVFCTFFLVETKDKSFMDIQKELKK